MKYFLSVLLVLAVGIGCKEAGNKVSRPSVISHINMDASCPYFTQTAEGIPVVSWIEKDSAEDAGTMFYTLYDSATQMFGPPIEIPVTKGVIPHDENLPKMLFKKDGVVIAVFGVEANDARNKYAGKVMYTQSFDGGRSWQAAQPLVRDTAGYDQRYFDVAVTKDGEGAIVWLDNRKDTSAEGSSVYFAKAAGKEGFRDEKRIVSQVCQCCRTRLYVAGTGDIHIVYRAILNDSIRDMVHQVSVDQGQTFSSPVRISADNWVVRGCPHTGPTLTANSSGLHFAWFTMGNGKGAFYCKSVDNGLSYTKKESLSDEPMAKHPQIYTIDDRLLLVWDEPVPFRKSSNSRIGYQWRKADGSLDRAGRLTDSTVYASYPVLGSFRTDAMVAYKQIVDNKGRIVLNHIAL